MSKLFPPPLPLLPPPPLCPPLPSRRSASLWTGPRSSSLLPCEAVTKARSRDAAHARAHRCWSEATGALISVGLNTPRERRLCRSGASDRPGPCSERVSPRAAGLKKRRSIHPDTFTSRLRPALTPPSPSDTQITSSPTPADAPLSVDPFNPV